MHFLATISHKVEVISAMHFFDHNFTLGVLNRKETSMMPGIALHS